MSDVRPMTDEETRMMQTIISLRLENNELKDKAEREAVELVVLRAENERLQAYIVAMVEKAADQKLDGYREMGARCAQLEEQIDALRAENERLRPDAERYRWLRGHGSCPWAETDDEWVLPENMDAAVDAAMKANGLPESP